MLSAMSTLTYQYVYFASGPHTRQPRSSSGPGGFTLIQTLPGGTLSSGDTFVAGAQPSSETVDGNTFPFAFVSVSGGTQGGVTSLQANVPAPSVTVGSADIVVLVVYAPTGGGGIGGSGATIDSFDIATGSLFDDTFVSVSPDSSGALTTSGNVEGYVDTTNSAETITALSPTTPTNVNFVRWLTLPSTVSTSESLAVDAGVSVSALAFYNKPPAVVPPPLDPCQESLRSLNQIVEDNDRPRLTVAMFNAIKAQLEKCVAEKKLTQTQVTDALNAYLDDLNPPVPPRGPGGTPKL
jgi:hypothetical protein